MSSVLKYTFLGTAAAEGWPGLFCNCSSCQKAQASGGKNLRLRTSALINDDMLCDLSPDLLTHKMRYNINMQRIKNLLITHTHQDHFNPQMLNYNTASFSTSPVPLNIFCSEYTKRQLLSFKYENANALNDVIITSLSEFETLPIPGGYRITALPAQHSAPESYLYLIEKDGMTIFYCNDTYLLPDNTLEYLKKVKIDIASFDATMGIRKHGYKRHLSFHDIVELVQTLKGFGACDRNTLFAATHFSHFIDMSHEQIENFFRQHDIITAYDGLTLEVQK